MNKFESIKRLLLDYPQHYIMYDGGFGGEFLSGLISKYSSNYQETPMICETEFNRYRLQSPLFHNLLAVNQSQNIKFDDLVNDFVSLYETNGYNFDHVINGATEYLDQSVLPRLLRTHISPNEYFTKSNTWLVLPDNAVWNNYGETLKFIKVYYSPIHINELREFIGVINSCSFYNYDQIKKYLTDNKIDNIYWMHLQCLMKKQIADIVSLDDIFLKTPQELFKTYQQFLNSEWSMKYNYMLKYIGDRVNHINYSSIFVAGYLEDTFDITSSEFHDDLIKWHENNLKLMTQHNFDTTPYILS